GGLQHFFGVAGGELNLARGGGLQSALGLCAFCAKQGRRDCVYKVGNQALPCSKEHQPDDNDATQQAAKDPACRPGLLSTALAALAYFRCGNLSGLPIALVLRNEGGYAQLWHFCA